MKILWANFYCLLDTSSGASISVRQILSELKLAGHDVRILGATVFDAPKGVSKFGNQWKSIEAIQQEKFFEVNDEDGLNHVLLKTSSLNRDQITSAEMGAWHTRYTLEIQYFKPDFIFFYGGGPAGFIPAEARAWNIPVGAYLVNESFNGHRWCRDVDTFITDTQATRDLYRERLNIDPVPIGKFIGQDKIAKERQPVNLLFINPSLSKGVAVLIMMARYLEKRAPNITIEVIESRGDWDEILRAVNYTTGRAADDCPSNIKVTANTADMASVYSRTRVLFVPSLWFESGARVIAEAQLNGIPVVATNRGGNKEMVGAGGVIFNLPEVCYQKPYMTTPTEEGIKPVAECIVRLFEDDDYYKDLSTKAKSNVRRICDAKKNTQTLVNHIQSLIDKKQTWTKPSYTPTAYSPFDKTRPHGEQWIYHALPAGKKGIFIDCGGYDGCSAVKFILNNPHFDAITFEPNPVMWPYYDQVPTTLIKKGIASKSGTREFIIDELDGDGSSFVEGKKIDYSGRISNDQFKKNIIEVVGIDDLLKACSHYDQIILKLDVEGAEYEVLDQLLESGLIKKIDYLYVEWHWHKCGFSFESHQKIYSRVAEFCSIQDWDALDMAIHQRDAERLKTRTDLLQRFLTGGLKKYQNNKKLAKFCKNESLV